MAEPKAIKRRGSLGKGGASSARGVLALLELEDLDVADPLPGIAVGDPPGGRQGHRLGLVPARLGGRQRDRDPTRALVDQVAAGDDEEALALGRLKRRLDDRLRRWREVEERRRALGQVDAELVARLRQDRKSTRLNSSHSQISY